jgi:hypothetical protein
VRSAISGKGNAVTTIKSQFPSVLDIFLAAGLLVLVLFGSFDRRQVAAPPAPGVIAYVCHNDETGGEIWLIEPDGSNERRIDTVDKADEHSAYAIAGLAWRPGVGEFAFAGNHELNCSPYEPDIFAVRSDGSGYRRIIDPPARSW